MPNSDRSRIASVARRARAGVRLLALGLGLASLPQTAWATLDINKSFLPINVTPGQTSTLQVDLFNNEPVPLSSVQFTDNLPAGIVIVASPAPTTTCGGTVSAPAGGTVISLAGGTVPAQVVNGVSGQCRVVLTVIGTLPGTLINTIPVGAATGTSAPSGGLGAQANPQPASATLTVDGFANLTGVKDFPNADPDFVKGGGSVPMTITLSNPNGAPLTGTAFTDNFPPEIVLSNATFSNTCGGSLTNATGGAIATGANGIRLSGGTIPANGSCRITVNIGPTSSNLSINVFSQNTIGAGAVTTAQGATNSAPLSAIVRVQSGGVTEKAFSPSTILGDGSAISALTLSLESRNALPIVGAGIQDNLPTGIRVAAVPGVVLNNCGPGTVVAAAGSQTITVSNATIPGAPNVIDAVGTCTVTVNVVTDPGTRTNELGFAPYFPGGPDHIGSAATLVGTPAIAGSKAFTPASVLPGGNTLLVITLTNASALPATITGFTDNLTTAGANVVIATPSTPTTTCGGTVVAPAGGTSITKTNGAIPAGGSCTISVPVTVQAAAAVSTRTNAIATGAVQTNRGNNVVPITANLVVTSAVGGTKSFNPSTVAIGSLSTLTIVLNNTTATPAVITAFNDNLTTLDPSGNIQVAAGGSTTTCGGTVTAPVGGTAISKTNGTIPANGSCSITVPIVVRPGAPLGALTNTIASGALVTSIGSSPNPITGQLTVITAISGTKAFNPTSILRGGTSTLTITLRNAAQVAATINTNGVLDNLTTLDAGGNVVIGTGASSNTCGGTLTATAGTTPISLSGGTIPAGGTCQIVVPVTANTNAPSGVLTNTIPAGNIATSLGNSVAPVTATLQITPSISITKSFAPATVGPGQVSRLTVVITRPTGAPALSNLSVTDSLATLGAGYVVATPANITTDCGGTVTGVAGATSFSLAGGAINAATASCSIGINILTPNSSGTGTNRIPVGAVTTAQGLTNDVAATATLTRAVSTVTLTLNKSFQPTSVSGNTPSVLSILVNNNQAGAIAISSVALTDNLPNGMIVFTTPNPTFTGTGCANATISAVPGASSIGFSGATIAAGSLCTLSVNVTGLVDGNLTNNIPVGVVTSTQGVTNSNSPQATLTVLRNIDVTKTFTPSTITVGQTSVLTLIFNNNSPINQTNAALIDNFPNGLIVAGPATSNTCGAGSTVTNGAGAPLAAGATSIRLNNGTFAPNSSCQLTVPVTSPTPGVYVNSIPSNTLTTDQGGTNSNPTSGTVTNLGAPTIAKAFSPTSIAVNGVSTITFTLTNPNNGTLLPGGYTGAGFTDTLTGISIAAAGAAGGTCTGVATNTFTAGQTALTFGGLGIPAGGSCTVTVGVTAAAAGTFPNTASGVATTQTPTPGPVSNTVNLTVLSPPQVTKAFLPTTIIAGAVSRLTITLTNVNATPLTIGDPGLVDTFPTTPGPLTVAATPNLATTCVGATVNNSLNAALAGGAGGVRVNGGTIPANASCTVSVDVTGTVAGSYVNTTGLLNTTNAGSSTVGGSANLAINPAIVGVPVNGNVYRDANINGTLDGAETWTAGAPVFVNLVQNGVVVASVQVPPGSGAYQFPNVLPGNYTIIVTDSATNIAPVSPPGFRFVVPNDGTQTVTVGATVAPPYNFGLIDGGLVSGRVFRDGGPTANNGIQESPANEPGLAGVPVRLTDCAATVYSTGSTNGNGDYSLSVPGTVATGAQLCVEETNLPGYLSTGANVANTPLPSGTATTVAGTSYVYTRAGAPERTQFAYSTTVRNYSNINFADIPPNDFTTDNKQTSLPGTTVLAAHTYTAQSGGTVTFSTSAIPNPAVPGWVETLYLDVNCDGAIGAGDTQITGPITLTAGQQICIIDREFIPANAPSGAKNLVTVTATFNYTNASPILNSVLTHTDTTIVGEATGAALNLVKTVSSGTASPGTILTYTVTYTNRSTQPLSNIVVNDATPPFTTFVSAAAGALPASLTACSKTTPAGSADCSAIQTAGGRGALSWTFVGTLQPGGVGTVSFQVQVEP